MIVFNSTIRTYMHQPCMHVNTTKLYNVQIYRIAQAGSLGRLVKLTSAKKIFWGVTGSNDSRHVKFTFVNTFWSDFVKYNWRKIYVLAIRY